MSDRVGSKVGLKVMPIAIVTLSEGRGPKERAPTRRYGGCAPDRCSSLGVSFCACRLPIRRLGDTTSVTPARSRASASCSVAAMTAPRWFFRFMYDRESAAWERRRDEPEHRELVKRIADELANVVAPARTSGRRRLWAWRARARTRAARL
jgi:hypothetical protein